MKKEYLKQIFWDVDENNLKDLSDSNVIKRSLSFGTVPVLQDMFSNYKRLDIKSVFNNLKIGEMSKRRHGYFYNILNN